MYGCEALITGREASAVAEASVVAAAVFSDTLASLSDWVSVSSKTDSTS